MAEFLLYMQMLAKSQSCMSSTLLLHSHCFAQLKSNVHIDSVDCFPSLTQKLKSAVGQGIGLLRFPSLLESMK